MSQVVLSDEQRRLAYHEAGHAVVGNHLWLGLLWVDIGHAVGGETRFDEKKSSAAKDLSTYTRGQRAVKEIRLYLAGQFAQAKVGFKPGIGCFRDQSEIERRLSLLEADREERLTYRLDAERHVEKILEWKWAAVEALAQALLRRNRIESAPALRIIWRALTVGGFFRYHRSH